MTLKIVFNNECVLFKDSLIQALKDFKVDVETYDEDYYKDKKKAIVIKSSCGARLNPFVAIYKDKELVKAFYSETKDCIVDNIINYINDFQ